MPNGHITLIKNPRFYDARTVHIEKVTYYPTTDTQAAMKQMQAGELDTQQTLPLSEISWLRKNMSYALTLKPYLGVSYIIFNFARHPFADRRLREALSLAFDRDAYMNGILKLNYPPAYSFVPPLTANYPSGAAVDFEHLTFPQRLQKARASMAELGYGPQNHFHTTYTTFSSPDNNLIAAATQAMMKRVYVDVDIVKTDAVTYYRTLGAHEFDLAPTGWIGDFDDASAFLDLLETGNGNNYGSYSNPAFDSVYREARQQTELRTRGLLMRKAEQIALDDDAIVPVRFLVTLDLVQPYVNGWNAAHPNLRNFHRTRWLWLNPKAAGQ